MTKAITPEAQRSQLLRLQRARRLRLERAGQLAGMALDGVVRWLMELVASEAEGCKADLKLKAASMLIDLARAEPKYEDLAKVEQHLHLHSGQTQTPSEAWAEEIQAFLSAKGRALKPVNGRDGHADDRR